MGGKKLDQEMIYRIHKEYLETDIGLDAIGKKYKIDYRTLKREFSLLGLAYNKPKKYKPAHNIKFTKEQAEATHRRYLSGESRVNLAKEVDVSESCLSRTWQRYNLVKKSDDAIKRDRVQASQNTSMERYGLKHAMQTDDGKRKMSEISKRLDWETITNKRKLTNLDLYGVENPSQLNDVKQKKKDTTFRNYGVEVPLQASAVKEKLRVTKWATRLERLTPILESLGYTLLDEYTGNRSYDEDRKHVAYKKYQILHTHCGNAFYDDLFEMPRCPVCYPAGESLGQTYYFDLIKRLLPNETVIKGDRTAIKNTQTNYPLELDIYIPSRKIAFEYNGVYYHSGLTKDKQYHATKTTLCLEAGIRLFHIWECDSPQIIESRIKNLLGFMEKLGARSLAFSKISLAEANVFLIGNHLHGDCACSYAYGLKTRQGDLLSVMTLRKSADDVDVLEIARFCTKIGLNIQGGFQKLLKNILRDIRITKLLTYADRDWTPDPLSSAYAKAGFEYQGDTGVSLRYVHLSKMTVHSRLSFQKYKLKDLFPDTYHDDLTAQEILSKNQIVPLYNSGNHRFLLEIKKPEYLSILWLPLV